MSSLIETSIKNGERYHFDEITIIKDLDLDKILVYEKPIQNIFIYRVHIKFDLVKNLCILALMNQMDISKSKMDKSI